MPDSRNNQPNLTKLSEHDFNVLYHTVISVPQARRTKAEEQAVRRAIIERDRRKASKNRRQAMMRVAAKVGAMSRTQLEEHNNEVRTSLSSQVVKKAPAMPQVVAPVVRVEKALGPCTAVEGYFVFGPQFCDQPGVEMRYAQDDPVDPLVLCRQHAQDYDNHNFSRDL